MKHLRLYSQLICAFMALLVLNVSVDIPDDLLYKRGSNQLSINEIESVAELVLEECMGEENCFPETEGDDDGSQTHVKKGYDWKTVLHSLPTPLVHQLQFKNWIKVYNTHYTGINYSNIPYTPPCSA